MRVLGPALVVASLLLGSGGVVYRRPAQAQQATVQPAASSDEQETCRAQPVRPAVRHTRIAPLEGTGEVVSVGTRGFNYSRPGDPIPTEVRPAGASPAAPRE